MQLSQKLRKHWKLSALTAGVLAVALGLGVAASLGAFTEEPQAAPVVKVAKPPPTKSPATPQPESTQEPKEESEAPIAPLQSIEQVNHMAYSPVWNPPDQGQGFWQVVDPENGYPEAGGTRYVLAHACESHDCAGDRVMGLRVGDTFEYLGEPYRVDEHYPSMKADIAAEPLWEHVPGKIVMVTCIIEGDWRLSDQNSILVASPAA